MCGGKGGLILALDRREWMFHSRPELPVFAPAAGEVGRVIRAVSEDELGFFFISVRGHWLAAERPVEGGVVLGVYYDDSQYQFWARDVWPREVRYL